MNLNDLLTCKGIDPEQVVVLRHRPKEPDLRKKLPWLAAAKPEVFNAYQQAQDVRAEQAMKRAKYAASFIGLEPGKALFVGLYSIKGSKPITQKQFWKIPGNVELKKLGIEDSSRSSVLWFDLELTDFYPNWKGKLVVSWPPPERSWFRRAHRNEMPVFAILEESALEMAMPNWRAIDLTREELRTLPSSWKAALTHWRGIYYIFDRSDRKGYVGSAYGDQNLLGRWNVYAIRGHAGNRLLRNRDPANFQFTILQRVGPDMVAEDIIQLESTWKDRLHTRQPFGLNDN